MIGDVEIGTSESSFKKESHNILLRLIGVGRRDVAGLEARSADEDTSPKHVR